MVPSRFFPFLLAGLLLAPALPLPAQDRTPWLGVYLDQSEEGLVEILQVLPGSPAEKAGLLAGDRILACDQVPVPSVEALIARVRKMKPGRKVKFRVLRDRKRLNLLVTLGKAPGGAPPPGRPAPPLKWAEPTPSAGLLPPYLGSPKDLDRALRAAREKGGGKPLLLVFTAPWCGPGKVLEENFRRPPLQAVLRGFSGVFRVDVDRNPALADRYKVDGIPHLQVIDGKGRPLGKVVGAVDPRRVAERLGRLLLASGKAGALRKRASSKPPSGGRKPAAAPRKNTDELILRELIRIRKLLEEIKNRLG